MKQHNSFILMFTFSMTFAQIPNGYYNSATGNGYQLKTQLYNIINQQYDQGYSAIDNFFIDYDLDNYYENNNSILDIYSENPIAEDPYNFTPGSDECGNYSTEGDCYNKEHIIPKSVFNENSPMHGDAHNLLPTDGRVNGLRANFPMGRVDVNNLASQSGISNPTQNGSKLGENFNNGYSAGYSGTVFEPIDEFKGDVARIHFYFATRYQNQISNWSDYPMFNGSSNQVFETVFLNILLEWHNMDPVSQKEIDRNDNIYYEHQGNRNPFVDHPEYVEVIWNSQEDNEPPTAPTDLTTSNPTSNSIELSWSAASDNIAVISYDVYVNDSFYSTIINTFTSVTGLLSETNYCFTVFAKDAANNTSIASNQACGTTISVDSTANTSLFFSEYMEGSGNNKALEIANFSETTVNLSNYELRLSSNGNSAWTASYNFPENDSIENGDVYVVGNGGSQICTDVFDIEYNAITAFNGNDAIGLFKNGVLIDLLGALGDDSDYAKNTTLVRNANVAVGSTVFDVAEWSSYQQNTCDDLGSHSQNLNSENFIKNHIKLYPNPSEEGFIYLDTIETAFVEVYNFSSEKVHSFQLQTGLNKIDLQGFSSGVYIFKIQTKSNYWTHKIIKQ